jgi:hypothetical protein
MAIKENDMKTVGVKCDTCLKIWSQDLAREPLPMPWFKVQEGMGDEQHFCSIHCLHEWVEKQMPVVENSNVNLMPAPTTVVHNEYWRDL